MVTEPTGSAYPGSHHAGRGYGSRGYADRGYASAVDVHEWQFYILDGEQTGAPWRENNNGLVALSSGVAVFSGTETGQVPVTAYPCEEPPPVDHDGWDEIVEVSYYTARSDALVCAYPGRPVDGIPVITRYGPGMYRMRVHARGRDIARSRWRSLTDEFHIAIWPAPGEPTVIHKTTDQVGRLLRAGFVDRYHYR